MPLAPGLRGSPVARELGGLALSVVQVDNPMLTLRAAHWRNALLRVGLSAPFWAVHDLGLLLVAEPEDMRIGARAVDLPPALRAALESYARTVRELAESEVVEKARQWRLSDELLGVLLLKVLGPLDERYRGQRLGAPAAAALPIDPEVYRDLDGQLPALFSAFDRADDEGFLAHLARERLRLLTSVEQIDLDTLRLLGMFGAEATGALQTLDLLNVFESPEAHDVVNFSLDLLPSVLETKKASGQQTFSVDGYAGLERRGTLDSLVLSELAFDDALFDRRFAENEVFYYAREKQHEEERRLHYILVDASASMRGQRSVFARGLALTLLKKLQLRGEDVYFRFFDSRLYEVQRARRGRRGGISVPYVLSFKGERGRNYAKVFAMLVRELERLERRERRTPIVYILTHAQCHVPLETIERLRAIARLYGVFMLPSTGELKLDYLHRLHTVQVVDHRSLGKREARAARALAIVDDASRRDDGTEQPRREARRSVPPPPPGERL